MPDSILTALARRAESGGNRTALTEGERRVSFAELDRAVRAVAAWAAALPDTVGLAGPKCADWVVADLALVAAGKAVVPLPDFFSPAQTAHVVRDAGVGFAVVVGARPPLLPAGLAWSPPGTAGTTARPPGPASRIVYTSGTTGTPKGVRLDERQLCLSAAALLEATSATSGDVHLSVLPFALLLEQVAGIRVPLLAGAATEICTDGFAAALAGDDTALAVAAERSAATTTILVPALLSAWVAGLRRRGRRAPESLRLVAVGGAAVPADIATAAWDLGLPVHEGYGLTECCSVVALNRPGDRRKGTVGRPLGSVDVRIEAGEIVVRGPTVMRGYLGRAAVDGVWATGDLGRIGPDGRLEVIGRRDDMIVTSAGRSVSPDWIEAAALRGAGVIRAVAFPDGPRPALAVCFGDASGDPAEARLAPVLACLPDYARPRRIVSTDLAHLRAAGLVDPGGKPRRRLFAAHFTNATGPRAGRNGSDQ